MAHMKTLHQKSSFNFMRNINRQLDSGLPAVLRNLLQDRSIINSCHLKARIQWKTGNRIIFVMNKGFVPRLFGIESMPDENVEELSDDDEELCPVECVREFKTDEEFLRILEKAKESNSLVVVDFYRTSCGSCKYIEQGFAKLCKGSGDQDAPVIFLKHNVLDEYDEQTDVADRLRIRSVPLFHFYKNGVLLEAFPTRDKERILDAILKYSALTSQEA
ncbi:thioredoxin-like 4, chloroplastic [Olea europaea var. sylvestris]|uniref:Thioredoxin-like 4, chloroplastic n=1 Tax=Olea europaea subsp. europaea TaxID=158383 RepID=A0A8S0PIX2_OLEEU|nr:thioredoxin-like 4, chloroplastic [Olea europaea var. sylvestris]XP_022894764.1 thioredoxin-like 4, chloroplastic [Olea europaea var. sylvestris]XP_022894765.1 thioredoxin-like 4, chloroplastic [Olea europaea var. sylvestris]XP_022894766.1 thioredoxin-like 4, chloroplastic [Olea europaea var. sylvestris]XP_022894767.1 thioredoxin-like 4, chloroplastic [Olea europaea var. sylvestris]CAA2953866.1 thioredoxin-like 4, chloroplastic [Olea europaea subsp. europaea]